MVKQVRIPSNARNYFSANELSGWMDGVRWNPSPKKKKKGPKPVRIVRPEKPQAVLVGQPS